MPEGYDRHRRQFTAAGDVHVNVLVAGWCEIAPDWWKGSTADQSLWRLYVNESPGAEVTIAGGRVVGLEPGRLWLLPAGLSYANRTRRRTGHLWVHFNPLGLSPGGVRALAALPIGLALDATLAPAHAALRAAALDDAADDIELRCLAKALVLAAFARWWRGLDPQPRSRLLLAVADPGLAPALARIESDLAAPLYNEALARACGLSASAFVRRFRAATGLSPAQFVLERRIARAAERLLIDAGAIEQVAADTGFSDRFYFTRVFTRRMGCSPAVYRGRR